ncbi:MAG: peptidylprolyl isomerase [Chloroflexi bacterium]|nr:peptidylprolyl isomerase [Chloroflexota bacterium]
MAPKKQSVVKPAPTRRQLAKWQREKKVQRTTAVIIAIAIFVVLGIPALGYFQTFVAPTMQPVVRVNNKSFDMGYYAKRLRLLYTGAKAAGGQANLSTIPFELLDIIEENQLIQDGGPKMGIAVTQEELGQELRRRVLPASDPKQETDPGRLDAEYNQLYRQRLNEFKLSDDEYRDIVKAEMMRSAIREKLGEQVPTVAEQVKVMGVLAETIDKANEALAKLKGGATFAAVVKEYTKNEKLLEKQGDMGWLPRGVMTQEFDQIAFGLEPGSFGQPFTDAAGLYVIKVEEKVTARKIDDEPREKLKDAVLKKWLTEERAANKVERYFDSTRYAWAMDEIRKFEKPTPESEQRPPIE